MKTHSTHTIQCFDLFTCWQGWLCKLSEAERWRSSQGFPQVLPGFPVWRTEYIGWQSGREEVKRVKLRPSSNFNLSLKVNNTHLYILTCINLDTRFPYTEGQNVQEMTLTSGICFRLRVVRSLRSILWKQSWAVKATFTVKRREAVNQKSASENNHSTNKRRHSPFLSSSGSRLAFFFLAPSCSSRDNSLSWSSPEQFMKSFHG